MRFGPSQIARMLKDDKTLKPVAYHAQIRGVGYGHRSEARPCDWCGRTVSDILEREEYIGHTINCRSYIPSFKSKKKKANPPEKWLRFENTHEPLVDVETWEIMQKVRSGKRRPNKLGEQDMFSGLIFCADCGIRHRICRCGSLSKEQYTYVCGTYHHHKDKLFRKAFKEMTLNNLSGQQFKLLTGVYEDEKQELSIRSNVLELEINSEQEKISTQTGL